MKFLFLLFIYFGSYSQVKIIDEIYFSGIKKMKLSFLNQQISSKIANNLDSLKVANDVQTLSRLNGISKVEFEIINIVDNHAKLVFKITENFTLIPTASLWTINDFAAFRIGLYEFNFLGKNNTLGAFYQNNNFNSFGIQFTSPQFFSFQFGLGSSFQKLVSEEPIFFNNTKANYKYDNTSFEIIGNYRLNIKNEFKLGFTIFKEKYNYIDGATAIDIPLKLELNKKLMKLNYTYENLDFDYYLLDGFKSNLYMQYVITENNFKEKFRIGWNDFMYFKKTKHKGNWATRLRVGFSDNEKSPFSPFVIDNNINIRGVGNLIDRGTGTLVLNTEFRQTIIEKKWFVLQGNTFFDSGSWRNPGGNLEDFTNKKNIRVYSGLGLRFIHKTIYNAVFRIDYGYSLTQNASKGIVFGIGQYF